MKIKSASWKVSLILPLILVASSCMQDPLTDAKTRRLISDVADQLETVQSQQDRWGKISISSPQWMEDTNQFKIDYDESVTNYAAAARANIVGGQASSLETGFYLGQAIQASATVPISTGSAPTSTNAAVAPALPTQAQTAVSNFAPVLGLPTNALTIDERQVVSKAINDKIAEHLLELIANPSVNTNKQKILFGVMQVTCQPGQATRKGYMADLAVNLNYGSYGDVGVKRNPDYFPNVIGVLPLIDSENVQLARSDRSQVELAQALSVAFAAKGLSAAANSLADYVRKQQSDVDTRNSLPLATSYASGSTFGFQVYPSLQAIANPGKADSTSGEILEPITFPAVVAISIDKADVTGMIQSHTPATPKPAPKKEKHKKGKKKAPADPMENYIRKNDDPPAPAAPADGAKQTQDAWNYLIGDAQTRWIRLKAGCPLFSRSALSYDLKAATAMDKATAGLTELELNLPIKERKASVKRFLVLKTAYEILSDTFAIVSTASDLSIESMFTNKQNPAAPVITDIFPHSLWRNDNTLFAIVGTNLSSCSAVTIAGLTCHSLNVDEISIPSKKAHVPPTKYQVVTATLPGPNPFRYLTNATVSVDFAALVPGKGQATKTVTLTLQGNVLSPDAVITVNRDTNSTKITGLQIKDAEALSKDKLLEGIKDILQKSEPAPKTVITSP